MKRFVAAFGVIVLLLGASCKRRETIRIQPQNPHSDVAVIAETFPSRNIWMDVRATRHSRGWSNEVAVLDHRFLLTSGQQGTCRQTTIRLDVAPVANEDGTIVVSLGLIELPENPEGLYRQPFEVVLLDGQTTTMELGSVTFTLFATTDLETLADWDRRKPYTFVEGTYLLHPRYHFVSGDTLKFTDGSVLSFPETKGGSGPPQKGRYRVDGEKLTLTFDGPDARTRILHHRIVDLVHLLIEDELVARFDAHHELELEKLDGYYFHGEAMPFWNTWWKSVMDSHPGLEKLFPQYLRY
ncbi:hypothetical protein ACXR0O_24875 [Verrucomicrobiota bacterium sgz303538]